ncbi:MAG: tRNA (adenosine(37)-N6)-dimethylallyltransferase MiaA [Trueperaceae bacterium]
MPAEALVLPMLAGPTASGKSAAALELALRFDLEIVSADAMQVYRGMDVGTAKPTAAERALVRHHLLDVVSPAEPYSVADYVVAAEGAIADVLAGGRLPLVTGGTGFYLRALREGLATVPAADPTVQAPLWQEVEQGRFDTLVARLEEHAPSDARRAGRNPRRVVRSLEILERTGRPPSAFPRSTPRFTYDMVVLLPSMEVLRPRIARRTQAMFEAGLVDEVRRLLAAYPEQPTALQAIGYKEVARHLRGEMDLEETEAAVTLATTQYAKRQRTWYRAERGARYLDQVGEDAGDALRTWLAGIVEEASAKD